MSSKNVCVFVLVALSAVLFFPSQSQAGVYNGRTPAGNSILVVWHNSYCALVRNGRPVSIERVILSESEIVILGTVEGIKTVQTTFSVTEGNLLIELSDAAGYGAERLILNGESGCVELAETCVCWGLAKKKRACTNSECNDPVSCNTGTSGSAYCEWREQQIALP